jgi:hypothetical protein
MAQNTLTYQIRNVPDGATLSIGINDHDGSWTLTPSELNTVALTPASDFVGDLTLNPWCHFNGWCFNSLY